MQNLPSTSVHNPWNISEASGKSESPKGIIRTCFSPVDFNISHNAFLGGWFSSMNRQSKHTKSESTKIVTLANASISISLFICSNRVSLRKSFVEVDSTLIQIQQSLPFQSCHCSVKTTFWCHLLKTNSIFTQHLMNALLDSSSASFDLVFS